MSLSKWCLAVAVALGGFASRELRGAIPFSEDFESYANQAAFAATWPIVRLSAMRHLT
jgi:hypothetical protein